MKQADRTSHGFVSSAKFASGMLLLVCAALPPCVSAQSPSIPAGVKEAPLPESVQRLYRASDIIGSTLRDRQQRKIGQIRDLLLDTGRGEVAYVVVTFKETRGKYHPLPWRALQPDGAGDGNGRTYLLQADRETRLQAPGFRRDAWPDLTDRDWSRDVDRFWGRMIGRDAGKANRLPPPSSSR